MSDKSNNRKTALRKAPQEQDSTGKGLRDFLVSSPYGILVVDHRGTLLFANQAAAAIFGCSIEQLIKDRCGFPPISDKTPELAVKSRDGKNVFLEVRGVSTEWDGIPATILHLQDITERKNVEEELRESEDKFSKAFQAVPALLSISSLADGRYIEVNETLETTLGYRRDELIGRAAPQFGIWENPDDRDRLVRLLQAGEKVRDFETRLRSKAGGIIVGSLSAEIINVQGEECLLALTWDVTRVKQAEEKLSTNEQQLAEAQRLARLGSWEWDIGTDKLTVSVELCRIFGVPPAELDATYEGILKMVHPEDREEYEHDIQQALAARASFDNHHRIIRPDGLVRILASRGTVTVDATGTPVSLFGTCQDVTERKQAEEALKESEERYRSLIELAPDAVILHQDGQFIYANAAALQLFGAATFEQLQEKHLLELVHPDDRTVVQTRMEMIGKGTNVPSRELRMLRLDGREVRVEAAGSRIDYKGTPAVQAIIRDISERKRAEEALRESENRFRTLAAASYEGIAITEQGRILDVNEQLTRILGYERSELIGMDVADLLPPEERDRVLANILHGQESHIGHEMLCRDGSRRIVEARARTIDQQGRKLRITAIRDITERKRAEEKIEILNTDLMARAAELEAVNQELEAFSYTVSHDLRKPLTVINGYSQVILEMCGEALDEECTRYLKEICGGTLRMSSLIDTLLKFSYLTHVQIKREKVDLSELAEFIASGLQLMEPRSAATFIVAHGVTGYGDADLIRVVLENLLGNAWKYTAGQKEAVIEFGVAEIAGEKTCFVRDNGPGFDMAQADKLFVPFQRLAGAARFQGHGIGLATVHRIIKRHGGKVWAEGTPGKGATFYFTLP